MCAVVLLIGALSNVMQISMLRTFLGGFSGLEEVLSIPIFYLYFVDLILESLLEILLAFGLFKFKKFVPILMVVLFLWLLGYFTYTLFPATPVMNDLSYLAFTHLTEIFWLIIVGALMIKTLKDRKDFQA